MENNGLGSLRISSLPRVPLDDLLAEAWKDPTPSSVLVTPFPDATGVTACAAGSDRVIG
jgi:hypothetical protein